MFQNWSFIFDGEIRNSKRTGFHTESYDRKRLIKAQNISPEGEVKETEQASQIKFISLSLLQNYKRRLKLRSFARIQEWQCNFIDWKTFYKRPSISPTLPVAMDIHTTRYLMLQGLCQQEPRTHIFPGPPTQINRWEINTVT